MARFLYALGRWAAVHRRRVLAAWILLLAVVGGLGIGLHGELSSVFSVPGTESQNAQNLLQAKFPAAAGGTARVVFAAPGGATLVSPKAQEAIGVSLSRAAKVPGVIGVSDPFKAGTLSPAKTIGYADVLFRQLGSAVPQSAKNQLTAALGPARSAGLQVAFGGTVFAAQGKVGGAGEIIGVVVAFIVLAVALGSLVAAGLPLATALAGVAIGVLGVEFLARFIQMTDTATVLATMVGLAVGIDYALFIVSRHREQLADPAQGIEDSIGRAIGTAGSAVSFAGATVVIALAALSAAGIPFLTVMGLAAAGTVALAVLVAITLVPAVLGFAGEKLRPKTGDGRGNEAARGDGAGRTTRAARAWQRRGRWGVAWAHLISRAPAAVLVVCAAGLLVVALPVRHLQLGLPGNDTEPAASTQHQSYDLLAEGFGPGFNATLAVITDMAGVPAPQRTAILSRLSATLRRDPGIAVVAPPVLSPAGTIAVLSVVPRTGPDASATAALVRRMRADDLSGVSRAGGTGYVAGNTAANIDVSARLGGALPLFISIIVVLAFILLTIAFRSLLVPLTAVLGFLLSIAASLGVIVWVFQYGHLGGVLGVAAAAPIVSFVPVLLVGVLFGLAMDYEVFLIARMRESFGRDGDAAGAVAAGVQRSGRVVCAAALIMSSVFAGFIFTGDPIIKSIAFALTIGVLIDAFVVRLTIIPAVMALLGRSAWHLPAWLDRVLPHADIEGAALPALAPPPRRDQVSS
jgi:putative drug exporter of the RND superfamily